MNKTTLILFIALSSAQDLMQPAPLPEIEPEPIADVQLLDGIADLQEKTADVDISAEHVTPIFQELTQKYEKAGKSMVQKHVMYHQETQDNRNNKLLLTYSVINGQEGNPIYRVTLKTGNAYAAEEKDRVHIQNFGFKCKIFQPMNQFLCLPIGCEVGEFEPVKPSVVCEDHYTRSQDTITAVFEVTKDVKEVEAFVECVRQKMETVKPTKETVCYYTGFQPNNIVSMEELETKLRDEGYAKDDNGQWVRKGEVIEKLQAQANVEQLLKSIS